MRYSVRTQDGWLGIAGMAGECAWLEISDGGLFVAPDY